MRYVIIAKSPAEGKTPTSRLVTGRDVAAPRVPVNASPGTNAPKNE